MDLGFNVGSYMVPLDMSMVRVIIYWQYFGKLHVKAFLGVTRSEPIFEEKLAVPEDEKLSPDVAKFYCRYCGAENESDAVFCEKCGKQLK